MGFKIISNRDENGEFIASADYWTDEKISSLIKKYNPNGILSLSEATDKPEEEEKEEN
ncbi:MAG: hypothetical protein FWE43_04335 [Streptococcaceae bacterium]|nr:hypothetical protein [Streptococcaceae bacterium]MCL2681697.1 hypothetical protein [Streptococcaceae bacterium]